MILIFLNVSDDPKVKNTDGFAVQLYIMRKFSVYHAKYALFKESFRILRSNRVIARSFPYNITISVLCRLAYSVMNPPPPRKLLDVVRETIRPTALLLPHRTNLSGLD
jgi:hypothetical protein